MAADGDKSKRFILVVDNDMAVLRKVENALRKNEYEVHLATDGALAINRALASPPEIVISAVEMPLLDGFKLCQLLRTNPITREVPFIFLTSKETSPQRLGQYLRPFDEFLLKPFKEDELLGRVQGLLVRMEKVEDVSQEGQALLGTLTEITLMDLLQILRMNRRSGFLDLEQEGRLATVFIRDGEVVNAKLGNFKGEKAFFRLLDWSKGKFEFRPQAVETEILIERPGENLILEGLRQLDEVNKIRGSRGGAACRLELVKHFQGPPEKLRPVTREVVKLLEYFTGLDDILDQSSFNDLEICQTLEVLIEKGIVAVSEAAAADEQTPEEPLLSLEEALKLSYQLGVGREEHAQEISGKILLFANSRKLLRRLLDGLSRHQEFKVDAGVVLDPVAKSIPLGNIGSVQILEGTELALYSFPTEASYEPLWKPLAMGALGGLILVSEKGQGEAAARFCDAVIHQPFLLCGPELPGGEAGEGAAGGREYGVRWSSMPLGNGKDDGYRTVFRNLFALILDK
jgi:CheY-like chemotaxis protein